MPEVPAAFYNPALLPPEVLLAEFTVRRALLATLIDIVRANAPGHPPQHVLLVGPRGMGKTTLLWAVAHSITLREPELGRQWQPVVFDEESRRVGDLTDFWLECVRQWEYATQDRSQRAEGLLDRPDAGLEDRARQTFLDLLQASGKRALLLVDNLNEIFASLHDPEPLHRLRAFLMEESRVMLIGGAIRWFDEVTALDKPFFDFFRPFELKPLSLPEMTECLAVLAEVRADEGVKKALVERQGTVAALHLLTGGNPRLIKTFYHLLSDGLHGDLRVNLENLLDTFTPYLKAIVDALPSQQQRVFDAIAIAWNPVEVGIVARATRLPSNQISAQVRALVKSGLVAEAAGTTKKKTYLLADRFSNIHYLMRHGRAARSRFDWFVSMVRILFRDEDYAAKVAGIAKMSLACGETGRRDAEAVVHSALRNAGSEKARRILLDRIAGSLRYDSEVDTGLGEMACRKALDERPNDAYSHAAWGRFLAVHLKHDSEAEVAYCKAIELDSNFAWPWNDLGVLQMNSERLDQAEIAYRKAIELDSNYPQPWYNLGVLFTAHFDRHAEAEEAYRKAIELDPKDATAWNNLGNLLTNNFARHAEAEEAYRKAIELDPKDATTWFNLGLILTNKFARYDEPNHPYRKAIELDPKDAMAWNNLGNVLTDQFARHVEAEKAYRKAIDLDPKDAMPWNNLGIVLTNQFARYDEAEIACRKAIELDPNDGYSQSNLAEVLQKKGQHLFEAMMWAEKGLVLSPSYPFGRSTFRQLCFHHPDHLRNVLPKLSAWCVTHPDQTDVFDFTLDAWLAFARLTDTEAFKLLESLNDITPFEILRDALLSHSDREHLHRLAPERRALVMKLLPQLTVHTISSKSSKGGSKKRSKS